MLLDRLKFRGTPRFCLARLSWPRKNECPTDADKEESLQVHAPFLTNEGWSIIDPKSAFLLSSFKVMNNTYKYQCSTWQEIQNTSNFRTSLKRRKFQVLLVMPKASWPVILGKIEFCAVHLESSFVVPIGWFGDSSDSPGYVFSSVRDLPRWPRCMVREETSLVRVLSAKTRAVFTKRVFLVVSNAIEKHST